jgi:hypothetical protein
LFVLWFVVNKSILIVDIKQQKEMSIKVSIPADYSSISVKQYVDYHSAKNDIERLLSISNLTKEQAEQIPFQHLPTLLAAFEGTLLNESAKFFETITIKDKDFGFIPDLYSISMGEYADISTWASDVNANIVKIMGTLYRPIDKRVGTKYTIIPHSKANRELVQSYVEQMTLEQFNGAMLFFSTLLNELSSTSLDYLEKEVSKLTTELEQLTTEKD